WECRRGPEPPRIESLLQQRHGTSWGPTRPAITHRHPCEVPFIPFARATENVSCAAGQAHRHEMSRAKVAPDYDTDIDRYRPGLCGCSSYGFEVSVRDHTPDPTRHRE